MKYRFIFYSLCTLLLASAGWVLNPDEALSFIHASTLWREPVMAGVVCGLVSGVLGLYMIWNRIVFVSLGIAQGAGFGIFLSFFVAGFWGISLEDSPIALLAGLLVAGTTAFLFVWFRRAQKHFDEVLIGLIYVAASGLVVLLGDRIAQGNHDIDNLLFGNAVAVTSQALAYLCVVAFAIFGIHFLFRRQFFYVSADADSMQAMGMHTDRWLLLLYLTLVAGITVSMKTLGSLPVFSLMVIAPFIALKGVRSSLEAVCVSLLLGSVIPALGYYFSFLYALPTGATIILVGLIYLIFSALETKLRLVSKKIHK